MAERFLKTLKLPGIEESYKIPQTAADVGARSADWMPSASDVGARPSDWIPSAEDVGAVNVNNYFAGENIPSGTNILALPNGIYQFEGSVTEDLRAQMNLPIITWHYDIHVTSCYKVDASNTDTNIYKTILCFTSDGDVFKNFCAWSTWNGWKKLLDSNTTAVDVGARPSTWTPTAADVGAAPAGKTIMQGLSTRSWYRVGVLYVGHEQGHTAIARMAIGGWFNEQNAKPAIVDIAFDYGGGYMHKVFNTLRGTHITSVRLCRIDSRRVAVDVYYGGSGSNNVYVTVYEIQGVFTANTTFVDVSSSTESVIATLNMNKAQTTQMDLLWVNATPGASFPAQTIPLDLSAYDCVEVVASVGSLPNAFFGSTKVPIGQMGSACGFYTDFWLHVRGFSVSATGIEFSSGQMKDLSNGAVYPDWDSRSVPYKIYGIKEGQ